MTLIIELFIALICHGGVCHVDRLFISREAMAIASCESGDGYNFGTYQFDARNEVTGDGGMWQFNDATYVWLTGKDHAERDHVATQHAVFVRLWDNGNGWRRWRSSQPWWSQWLDIESDQAVWRQQ